MRKSISQRIKIKKSGKILRRAMALGHARSNKTSTQIKRRVKARTLHIKTKKIKGYLYYGQN